MIDGYWISTVVLLALTLGVLYFRYSVSTLDSNWPLVYYAFAVLHLQLYPEGLNSAFVFTAVLAAMTLRFEFMSGRIVKVVQTIEVLCLVYTAYRLFDILFI